MERRLRTGAKADSRSYEPAGRLQVFLQRAATLPVLNARHALPWPARLLSAALAA